MSMGFSRLEHPYSENALNFRWGRHSKAFSYCFIGKDKNYSLLLFTGNRCSMRVENCKYRLL